MKTLRLIIAIVLAFLGILSIMLMKYGVEVASVNTGMVLLAFVVAYLIFSFGTVNQSEVGMMSVFGEPINDLHKGHGLYFAPVGIVSVRKESGTVFQDELPCDPEKIFRDEGKVPEGMFPPIRVKFGQPPKNPTNPIDIELQDDPYNVPMVVEVVPVVSWHITEPTKFFGVMGTVADCRKIMADKAVELFGVEFANVTPAKAALTLHTTSQKLENKLRLETATWGIEINDAYVKPFIYSHELNKSVVGVKIADQNAKATVLTAGAERKKRQEEATGTAEGIRALADAEKHRLVTTGLAKIDKDGKIVELVPDANTRVGAEAVKELAKVTGTLVLGGDLKTMLDINRKGEKS